jgi:CRISPR/Cas system CSM-associated protein Csm3 (group 7 of RAMP superfamily)
MISAPEREDRRAGEEPQPAPADPEQATQAHYGAPPILHVLRLAIEAVTPLSPASGQADPTHDNLVTRDANGLPQLYGPALAGVLSHVYADYFCPVTRDALFGWQRPGSDEGQESRIEVSFGYVHDAKDRAVEGIVDPADIRDDAVLRFLAQDAPVMREHVQIDRYGVADDGAKFDRVSIPAGTRFSLELALDGEADQQEEDKQLLLRLLSLIEVPYLRIGGKATTAGRIRLVKDQRGHPRAHYAAIDRACKEGYEQLKQLGVSRIDDRPKRIAFAQVSPLEARSNEGRWESRWRPVTGELTLRPSGYWRLGQTGAPLSRAADSRKDADMVPHHERVVHYDEAGSGSVRGLGEGDVLKAPFTASGLKGALAHRAEFHLNCLRGHWAPEDPAAADSATERGMDELLGSVKERGGKGRAGQLFIDDCFLTLETREKALAGKVGLLTHNSLDRFTQGVRSQVLFSEEALYKGEVSVRMTVLTTVPDGNGKTRPIARNVRQAFNRALADLREGRLAVGAGDGEGHGRCQGEKVQWSDGGAWLKDVEEEAQPPEEAGK